MAETRGKKSDGEEEIKEGTRDVVIQVWGCGLPFASRIKQQARRVMGKRWPQRNVGCVASLRVYG